MIINYIKDQKEHHRKETFYDEFKRLLIENEIEPARRQAGSMRNICYRGAPIFNPERVAPPPDLVP